MRVKLACLILAVLAGAALAQGSDRVTPLPSGPALAGWMLEHLRSGLEDVADVEASSSPNTFYAATDSPALPMIRLVAIDLSPAIEPEALADLFIEVAEGGCRPWQVRGALARGALRVLAQTASCSHAGSGFEVWVMVARDSDRARLVAMVAPVEQADALHQRTGRIMAAHGVLALRAQCCDR